MTSLKNRVALITGGGRGIGRAIALAFADAGADICLTARTSEQIELVAEEIRQKDRRAMAVVCDVSELEQVEQATAACVEHLGGLHVLVNNAGGNFERGSVAESDPEVWREVLDTNLLGVYYCCRAALPHLTKDGGKILNIGSGMGHSPRIGNSAYNTAKAGMWMLTRCLAMEVWEQGVEVNELVPGPVYTDLTAGYFEPPGGGPPPIAPSERVKTPEECAPLALFLAAHPPGGPTGQSFSLARRPLG